MKYGIFKSYSCYYWCVAVVADISVEILIKYVVFAVVDVHNVISNGISSLQLIIIHVHWI